MNLGWFKLQTGERIQTHLKRLKYQTIANHHARRDAKAGQVAFYSFLSVLHHAQLDQLDQ